MRQIVNYLTENGQSPFEKWFNSLKDRKAKQKIRLRLDRIQLENLGDYKSVGDGVFELRIDYGGGYRIYYGLEGFTIILLLCGGDKSTQKQDINQAKKYWKDYENRTKFNQ
jgi:putative addiction module killer protein